ncbi:HD domain-containing protein [Consotaella aegiceratis]|uniref:HD domain-containing protein n=1 Tax=Consotaella aegiceratis TaxID=3097961 RepID=UPI002F4189A1
MTGDVRLTKCETRIIDTPDFQRLRGVRQLGAAVYVYPTALHTRFDHSLGVLQELDNLISRIATNRAQGSAPSSNFPISARQRLIARLYALLHDITHVPFGHTIEDDLKIFESHDGFQKGTDDGRDRFDELLGPEKPIAQIIKEEYGEKIYQRFVNLFLSGGRESLPEEEIDGSERNTVFDEALYYLVSNTVCADLLDYLKRDSFFCNLNVSTADRVLNYIYIDRVQFGDRGESQVRSDAKHLVMPVIRLWKTREKRARSDLMTDLADLLDARYKIGERVYYHHAKIIVDAMIGRVVFEAKVNGLIESINLLGFSDDTLIQFLQVKHPSSTKLIQELANGVRDRVLYDEILNIRADRLRSGTGAGAEPRVRLLGQLRDPETRTDYENQIAEFVGGKPGDILIFTPSPTMNAKIASVVVDWAGKRCRLAEVEHSILKDRLKLIGAAHAELWAVHLLCHPRFDKEQRRRAHNMFCGLFLEDKERESIVRGLMTDMFHQPLGNHSKEQWDQAYTEASEEFVRETVSFKSRGIADRMQDYINRAIDRIVGHV